MASMCVQCVGVCYLRSYGFAYFCFLFFLCGGILGGGGGENLSATECILPVDLHGFFV